MEVPNKLSVSVSVSVTQRRRIVSLYIGTLSLPRSESGVAFSVVSTVPTDSRSPSSVESPPTSAVALLSPVFDSTGEHCGTWVQGA